LSETGMKGFIPHFFLRHGGLLSDDFAMKKSDTS